MKVSNLTESEWKVWEAAVTGTLVDLRSGDGDLDSPERWNQWTQERIVRAEVIVALLIGDGDANSITVRGVRLQGAHIIGDLNLEATTLRCSLALLDCSFADAINLNEATAVSVYLGGSHAPAVYARQLQTRGDLRLDTGFSVSAGVKLVGAHIGGQFLCTGGHFSNSEGPALNAQGLTVEGGMFCRTDFSAIGEVSLAGAHIKGQFACTGGHFSNSEGPALNAQGLTVDGSMSCRTGFSATGEVSLAGAHIKGQFACTGGHFSNSEGPALNAQGLTVDGSMVCDEKFSAIGEVALVGAHIGGQLSFTKCRLSNPSGCALNGASLTVKEGMFCGEGFLAMGEVVLFLACINVVLDCAGAQFSNPKKGSCALSATRLTVEGDMFCRTGFSAIGEVSLVSAHITGQFVCNESRFSNPSGSALNLRRAKIDNLLDMKAATLEGILDLTMAKIGSYRDDQASWAQKLQLDGFVYDAIEGASVDERLKWLDRNESRYSPQIYDQLAAVYHRAGCDGDARHVLITKQRRHSAEGNIADKVWGFLLYWTVGYGYRTWQAFLWLAALLICGSYLFGYVYDAGDLIPSSRTTTPPSFNSFLYTLDLLLPVINLHQRDAWVAQGVAVWWSTLFIIMGWILATAVVLSITGLLKRDIK